MGTYFFTMIQTHYRTGNPIGITTGVVSAICESEAIERAWELAGNDAACRVEVEEIDVEQGHSLTIYKSNIPLKGLN